MHATKTPIATAFLAIFKSLFIKLSPNAKIPDGFTPTARLRCGGVSWRLDGGREGAVSLTGGGEAGSIRYGLVPLSSAGKVGVAGSAGGVARRSQAQFGQYLSSSATSCLHCGQDGCRLHLQLGQ